MTLEPFEIQEFGGLNLRDDPYEIGWSAAVGDSVNFDLDSRGRLRPARAISTFNGSAISGLCYGPWAYLDTSGNKVLFTIAVNSGTATAYSMNTGGTLTTYGGTWSTTYVTSVVPFATPGASELVIASTGIRSKYWSIATGNPANMTTDMKPRFFGVTPTSNRLVAGNFAAAADAPGGANGTVSTVFFSAAGNAASWGSTDYVHLSPGDGENITGICSFRDFLFVFKESKFFVFYGESTDETGGAVFNYRTVKVPSGLVPSGLTGRPPCVAGPDGVYFIAGTKVFRTDGGQPQQINDEIEGTSLLNGPVTTSEGRVFVANGDGQYVYYPEQGKWSSWLLTGANYPPVDFNGGGYGVAGSGSGIYKFGTGAYTGTVVYQTGKQRMSPAGTEGVLRELFLEGTGTIGYVSVYADGTEGASSEDLTPTAARAARHRKTARGRSFSLYLANILSGVEFSLSSVTANLQPSRRAGASS